TGKPLSGGNTPSNQASGWLTSGNLLRLEELGFAKGGLNAGAIFGDSSLYYFNPTLAFRGRLGSSTMTYGVHLGVGYGFSNSTKGIAFGGAYELFLGTLAVIGTDVVYFMPDRTDMN